jgi:hypothetical protein
MFVLNEKASLSCNHPGAVQNFPSQDWVTIEKQRMLVEPDTVKWEITGCPNEPPAMKPCKITETVESGYSTWIRVNGKRICLDTLTGFTDGIAHNLALYTVSQPGQAFVSEK